VSYVVLRRERRRVYKRREEKDCMDRKLNV
jgi:hypothetical protein